MRDGQNLAVALASSNCLVSAGGEGHSATRRNLIAVCCFVALSLEPI